MAKNVKTLFSLIYKHIYFFPSTILRSTSQTGLCSPAQLFLIPLHQHATIFAFITFLQLQFFRLNWLDLCFQNSEPLGSNIICFTEFFNDSHKSSWFLWKKYSNVFKWRVMLNVAWMRSYAPSHPSVSLNLKNWTESSSTFSFLERFFLESIILYACSPNRSTNYERFEMKLSPEVLPEIMKPMKIKFIFSSELKFFLKLYQRRITEAFIWKIKESEDHKLLH